MDERYLDIPEDFKNDPRLTPFRNGTAAAKLERAIDADQFAKGQSFHVTAPVCGLRTEANETSLIDTQLIYGEEFIVYGQKDDWQWGQTARDHYVGWVRNNHLTAGSLEATHQVISRGTFLYSQADLKSQPLMKISMASQVKVIGEQTVRGSQYLETAKGWLFAKHVRPLAKTASDFVRVGESMVGMTYLWAGRSTFGLDCSGFIQLAMQMAGIAVLRDSDMQEATIGDEIEFHDDLSGLERGDLVFWPGHAGMMRDGSTLLHANGHTMSVHSEPLAAAIDRIAYLYDKPRAIKRPFALSS